MLLRINPEKINQKDLYRAVDVLRNGGLLIYPTDSVYAIGCDLFNQKAFEKLCKWKGIKPEKSNFSFICADLSHLSDFTKPISNQLFRSIKKAIPGPYTFILEANSNVPKTLKQNRKTVGIRIPDNQICHELVRTLGNPIVSTSLHDENDELLDYFSDPELIYERFKDQVEAIIDGGFGNIYTTTIVDCSETEPKIIRAGLGNLDLFEGI